MTDALRKELHAIAAKRRRLHREIQQLDARERAALEAAWRERMPPTEIAALVERSSAHVRKFRPGDVPPARMGGAAKVKQQGATPDS